MAESRYWIPDDFIDNYAKDLSLKAQAVYSCLCRHANREGKTTIGCRKIAEKLGISKNTAYKAVQELQASHLVGRRVNPLSHFGYYTVPPLGTLPSQSVGQKEVGTIKEENLKSLNDLRKQLSNKFGWAIIK